MKKGNESILRRQKLAIGVRSFWPERWARKEVDDETGR